MKTDKFCKIGPIPDYIIDRFHKSYDLLEDSRAALQHISEDLRKLESQLKCLDLELEHFSEKFY